LTKKWQKWQKLEKPKIAHEIYRKAKKGGHASAGLFYVGMHFSTKKKTEFLDVA
jgi:hypothetical protein